MHLKANIDSAKISKIANKQPVLSSQSQTLFRAAYTKMARQAEINMVCPDIEN